MTRTSIIQDYENGALVGWCGLDSSQDLLCRRTCEDLAGDARGQHVLADETSPCRLVAGTTARDDGDIGLVASSIKHDLMSLDQRQGGITSNHSAKRLYNQTL